MTILIGISIFIPWFFLSCYLSAVLRTQNLLHRSYYIAPDDLLFLSLTIFPALWIILLRRTESRILSRNKAKEETQEKVKILVEKAIKELK